MNAIIAETNFGSGQPRIIREVKGHNIYCVSSATPERKGAPLQNPNADGRQGERFAEHDLKSQYGGAAGIRTLDELLTHTHFPGERLRPLGHRSAISLEVRALARCGGFRKARGCATLT